MPHRLRVLWAVAALHTPLIYGEAQTRAVIPRNSLDAVVLHPVFRLHYFCYEHRVGQLGYLGDALGADCMIADLEGGPAGRFPAFFRGSGSRNADWYGWNQRVLAPFDGVVDSVHTNDEVNIPGTFGRKRAAVIVFRRSDGVRVLYAHVHGITVHVGDSVRAGQAVARVGNNGPSKNPHTHVGAWRGTAPLQIRWDLRAAARLNRNPEVVPAEPFPSRVP